MVEVLCLCQCVLFLGGLFLSTRNVLRVEGGHAGNIDIGMSMSKFNYGNSGTELAKNKLEVTTFLTHFAGEVSCRPNPFFLNNMLWPLGSVDTEYLVIHRKRQRICRK